MSTDIKTEDVLNYLLSHATGDSNYGYGGASAHRIAKKIMVELVKAGYADFILLRDDEVNKWWTNLVATATEAFRVYDEKLKLYEVKMAAFEKLTEADRKVLGLRKPVKPKPLKG